MPYIFFFLLYFVSLYILFSSRKLSAADMKTIIFKWIIKKVLLHADWFLISRIFPPHLLGSAIRCLAFSDKDKKEEVLCAVTVSMTLSNYRV